MHRLAAVGLWIGLGKVGEDVREVSVRLLNRDPVLESSYGSKPISASVLHPFIGEQVRCVDRAVQVQRIAKAGRHDANNLRGAAVELRRLADYVSIPRKVLLPRLVAQNSNVVPAILLFAGEKCAAHKRLHAEDLEEIVSGVNTIERYRTVRWRLNRDFSEVQVAGERGKSLELCQLIFVIRP